MSLETTTPTGDLEYSNNRQATFQLEDSAGNQAEREIQLDSTSPDIQLSAQSSIEAEKALVDLNIEDEIGVSSISVAVNGTQAWTAGESNIQRFKREVDIESPSFAPGKLNSLTCRVIDWNGNTSKSTVQVYVRKYDPMTETRLELSAQYQPFFNEFTRCTEGRHPDIGQYTVPYPMWIFNRHIDELTGFGINRIMINVPGFERGNEQIRRFLKVDLIDRVKIEPWYSAPLQKWGENSDYDIDSFKSDLLEPHMNFIRETILSQDNITTFQGRPVVHIWNPIIWTFDYPYNRIMNEWNSYQDFVNNMRSLLTVDGRDPYIIGGGLSLGKYGYNTRQTNLFKEFDGITTWVAGADHSNQEDAIDYIKTNWEGHQNFVDDHDMEFVPMTFPGYDERGGKECGGSGRYIPRSVSFFGQLLEFAEEYRTTELVNSAVYNNWHEATHLEPGEFKGNDYGTAYLEQARSFQTQ